MAYVAPTTKTTGQLITAAVWNQDVKDNVLFLANPPACRVIRSADQLLADNGSTIVDFTAERFDTDTMHDTVTNNSRVTFNTAGLYVVTFTGEVTAGVDYIELRAILLLNGTTGIDMARFVMADASDLAANLRLSTIYKFAAADYIEVAIFQDNNANVSRNLLFVANRSPELSAVWVGIG